MDQENISKIVLQELKYLQAQGVIDSNTSQKITDFYKTQSFSGTKSSGFIQTISVIGVILIGLGVILFFASNWDSITDWIKTILLVSVLIATYIAAYKFSYVKKDYPKTGYSLMILGSIFYGTCIILLGQIYNIGGEFYQAMLLWFAGVLPLAYLTGFAGVFMIGVFAFFCFLFGYFDKISLHEFFYFFILSYVSIGFVVLSRLHTLERYRNFDKILNLLGVFGIFLISFILTFDIGYYSALSGDNYLFYLISGLILGISAIIGIYYYAKIQRFNLKRDSGYIFHSLLMIILGYIYSVGMPYQEYILVFMNVYFMIMILYVLYLGTFNHKEYLVNISLLFFVIFMIGKYFDWFYDLFDRSLFFIGGGILLLLGGMFLERRRRKIISTFNN